MHNDDFVGLAEPQSGGKCDARTQSMRDARMNRSSAIQKRINDFSKGKQS